jgi:hypothetical protein
MKMEYGGTGNKQAQLVMYRPGEMTGEIIEEIKGLYFSSTVSKEVRDKEIDLYDEYKNRQITFVSYSGNYVFRKAVATCSLFFKKSRSEKIPIEYAQITKITTTSEKIASFLNNSDQFSVDCFPIPMPVIEIGRLGAAKISNENGITFRARYRAIVSVISSAERFAIEQGIEACFLTCLGSRELQKIYRDKFFFEEIAEIKYTEPQVWTGKALWRYPIAGNKSSYC